MSAHTALFVEVEGKIIQGCMEMKAIRIHNAIDLLFYTFYLCFLLSFLGHCIDRQDYDIWIP